MMTTQLVQSLGTVLTAHAATIRRSMHQLQIDDPIVVAAFHDRLDELNALREELDRLPTGEPVSPMDILDQLGRLANEQGKEASVRQIEPGRWEIGMHDDAGNEQTVAALRTGSMWSMRDDRGLDIVMQLDPRVLFAMLK
jgi:hypothetical protein